MIKKGFFISIIVYSSLSADVKPQTTSSLHQDIVEAQAELEIIKTYGWSKLLQQLKITSYDDLVLVEPSWQDVQPCLIATMNHEVAKPGPSLWQDLTTTSFWQSLVISSQTIIKSIFWQNYLKYSIANSSILDDYFLMSRYESELSIFKYLS